MKLHKTWMAERSRGMYCLLHSFAQECQVVVLTKHSLVKLRHAPRTSSAAEWFGIFWCLSHRMHARGKNPTVTYLYQILEPNRQDFRSQYVSFPPNNCKKVSLCGLLNVFMFCVCQSFHSASQHQWLRWLSLQVCGRVARVYQDEPVQWKLQHSWNRRHGAGAADEERVSNAKFPSFWTFSTLYKGRMAVSNQMRSCQLSKVHFCRNDFCFTWCVISWFPDKRDTRIWLRFSVD